MKNILNTTFSNIGLLALLITAIQAPARGEQAIEVKEAYKHVGEIQIVCGRIISTKYLKNSSGGPIFLNFGRDHPNQQMTGVIWYGRYSDYFSYRPDKFLKRKTVCAKGRITEFEGKTQMEIRAEQQIKVQ